MRPNRNHYILSFVLLALCLVHTKRLYGQPCDYYAPLYFLESQEEVDGFADFFSDCSYLTGELFISGSDITDLSPLAPFDSIDALSILFCENLPDLTGLENLVYVRDMWLFGNDLFENYTGLEGLVEIAGEFILGGSSNFSSLTGLSSVTFIDSLIIDGNLAIEDFSGLSTLDSIGYLLVNGSTSVIDFTGLPDSLGIGYLRWEVTAQENFAGFENLQHLSKLDLRFNNNLVSLAELSGIESLELLSIQSSPALQDFDGLQNVEHISTIFLHSLSSLTDFTGLSGLVTVDQFTIGGMDILASFNGLSSLEAINVQLDINSVAINSFDGLPNLVTIPSILLSNIYLLTDFQEFPPLTDVQYFNIQGTGLTSLQGLEALQSIDTMILSYSPQVNNLQGLSGVTEMRMLDIRNMNMLEDFTGLENLSTLDELIVSNNNMLNRLTDWPLITRIGSVLIHNNNALDTLDAWPNLDTIDQDLIITSNDALSVVLSLDFLRVIGGNINIEGNAELDTVLLPALVSVAGEVSILNNPQLENCCMLNNVHIGEGLILENNAGTCQSLFHLSQYCPDEDEDGVDDREDNCPDVPNHLQGDVDQDGVGDACDNCPNVANADQADDNNNHIGNQCETPEAGKVGINETSPASGLHIKDLDVYHDGALRGIILTSPSGDCFRLYVNDEGNLYTIAIDCPN